MTSGSQIKSLHEELKKIPNFSSFNATTNCEINESEEFQKTLHYITIKLREEAEKAMESLKKRVFEKVSEAINYYSVNKLRHLEKQRINQWSQRIRNQMLTGKNQHQQIYRIQACLKLIKKTKNLNLLAALIRENKVPDQEPFIQAGFLNALPLMQAKYPSLTLTLVKSCQDVAILIETDPEVAKAIRLGWRNYANQRCPFKMFPICGVGCEDDDCELRGLYDYVGHRKYVKEAFVGKWLVNSFENTRAKNLENQSLIKLNIDTFMLPISRSITINAQRQKFIQAALKHLQLYLEKGSINEIEKKDLAIVIENHLD